MPPVEKVTALNADLNEDLQYRYIGYTKDFSEFGTNSDNWTALIDGEYFPANPHQIEGIQLLQGVYREPLARRANRDIETARNKGITIENNRAIYTDRAGKKFLMLSYNRGNIPEVKIPPPEQEVPLIRRSASIVQATQPRQEVLLSRPVPPRQEVLLSRPVPPRQEAPSIPVLSRREPARREAPAIAEVPTSRRTSPLKGAALRLAVSPPRGRARGEPISSTQRSVTPRNVSSVTPVTESKTQSSIFYPNVQQVTSRSALFEIVAERIYHTAYAPPGTGGVDLWAKDAYVHEFDFYAPKVRTYTLSKDKETIKRLLAQKEPVNMTMNQHYNKELLLKYFGYSDSYYKEYYNNFGTLAPNYGIYMLAPAVINGRFYNLNFYHAIGVALDHKDQPDYKVLATDKEALIEAYKDIFTCIAYAGTGYKRIIMSVVGGSAFATYYKGGNGFIEGLKTKDVFQNEVWIPAFEATLPLFKGIQISFTGGSDNPAIDYFVRKYNYDMVSYFPQFVTEPGFNTKDTLIINAYDMHSFTGNGNKLDNSLDGKIGEVSAVQFFGWGLSNPHLLRDENILSISPSD
jgi:hypothetical protein